MSAIITILSNLKLTAKQYAYGAVALIIAGLVFALKLQGSRLHKAQVDLLRATYGAAMSQQDANVESARKKFLDALALYEGSNEN